MVVGTVTAYVFTFVPEWTTWALLVAMALYDLWAVLSPGGPLKARHRLWFRFRSRVQVYFSSERTTWALLVAVALHDLWAVLSPGRPAQGTP